MRERARSPIGSRPLFAAFGMPARSLTVTALSPAVTTSIGRQTQVSFSNGAAPLGPHSSETSFGYRLAIRDNMKRNQQSRERLESSARYGQVPRSDRSAAQFPLHGAKGPFSNDSVHSRGLDSGKTSIGYRLEIVLESAFSSELGFRWQTLTVARGSVGIAGKY